MSQTILKPLNRMAVHRVTLSAGQSYNLSSAGETLIHILIGTIGVSTLGEVFRHLGERANVFDAPPTCIRFPSGHLVTVWPETDIADVIIVTALGKDSDLHGVQVIRPQDVRLEYPAGKPGAGGPWPHLERTVRVVAGGDTLKEDGSVDKYGPTRIIYGGETINPPGGWSSYPHHEFDERAEWFAEFEEVFTVFHRPQSISVRNMETMLRRRGRFCDGSAVDDTLMLKAGESAVVPLGHHPICAPLEGELLYVWHYLSPLAKQYATSADDGGMYK